jgi:hypothetical protein
MVTSIGEGAINIGRVILDFFSGIFESVKSGIADLIASISEAIKGIPVLGNIFDGGEVTGKLGKTGAASKKWSEGLVVEGGETGIATQKNSGNFLTETPSAFNAALDYLSSNISAITKSTPNIQETNSNVTHNTINSPITVNAAAGMDAQAVARAVSIEWRNVFADVKTTGIRR